MCRERLTISLYVISGRSGKKRSEKMLISITLKTLFSGLGIPVEK
jgi:hypothetical protein